MGRLRKTAKALSRRARQGDVEAARALLSHSVRLGHRKLAVRRLFLALAMGARNLGEEARYCRSVAAALSPEALRKMAEEARRDARLYACGRKADA